MEIITVEIDGEILEMGADSDLLKDCKGEDDVDSK